MKKNTVRRKPKQSRSIETMRRAREAAAVVLENSGFDGFSMQAVADEAGIAIGTLYQYFTNKYAILESLVEEWYAKTDELVQGREDGLLDIEWLARIYLNQKERVALLEAVQAVPALAQFNRDEMEKGVIRLARRLNGGVEGGGADLARARVLLFAIDGALREAARQPAKEAELMVLALNDWVRGFHDPNRRTDADATESNGNSLI